ncbi:MAG: DsbA family protein [Alphaproteobacteria bacterium]|nr:DsbA family protein [Alphaproteobacteria bacterium]
MRFSASILGVLAIALMPTLAFAVDTPAAPFTDAQKAAVEQIVRDLLTKKEPDLVIKAVQEIQGREEKETATKGKEAVIKNHDKIFNDASAPVGGNPKGDVTVVEFFDYQCGYCKMTQEIVGKLVAEDKNIKLVYKEYPILGPDSARVAKAALASVKQGKYVKFHDALMATKEPLADDALFRVAKDVGLDVEKLKKDMDDEAIEKMVKANREVGVEIGARGTPTFVIGEQVFPGAVPLESLKQAIAEARKSAKK